MLKLVLGLILCVSGTVGTVSTATAAPAAPPETGAGDPAAKAGPSLLDHAGASPAAWQGQHGGEAKLVPSAAAGSRTRDASLTVKLPAFSDNPDNFNWERTAAGVMRGFDPTLDLRPWDVVAIEVENVGRDRGDFGIRIRGSQGTPVFAFLSAEPGQTQRMYLNLKWTHPQYKPEATTSLLIHKSYPPLDASLKFTRLRPAHRAITFLWDLQDRLSNPADDHLASEDRAAMLEQAEALEQEYWDGQITGGQLETRTQKLIEQSDQQRTASLQEELATYAKDHGQEGFVTSITSAMQRLPLTQARLEPRPADSIELWAAGREREHAQVAIVPLGNKLQHVSWSVGTLTPGEGVPVGGRGPIPVARVRVVGYMQMSPLTRYEPMGPNPSWRADPLIEGMTQLAEVPADEQLPLLVSVDVPADTPAGAYTGSLTIRARGVADREVPLTVHVRPFNLPATPVLRTAMSTHYPRTAEFYSGQDEAMTRKWEDLLLDYGLDPGELYRRGTPPSWSAQRLKQLKEAGLTGINLGYIYVDAKIRDDLDASFAEVDRQLDEMVKYLPTIDEAGVRDLVYIYALDELSAWRTDFGNAVAAHIHKRLPDIPVMMTMRTTRYGTDRPDGGDIDIYVPRFNDFHDHLDEVQQSRAMGNTLWWYTCANPEHPYPNLFVDYPLIESRLMMGVLAAKYRPEGFLYYATNRWPAKQQPITTGPRTEFMVNGYIGTNGDGIYFYPGPEGPLGSLRLENMRDGLEDLAYYHLLREQRGEAAADAEGDAEVSEDVARSLVDYSRDPDALAAERQRVAELIVEGMENESRP